MSAATDPCCSVVVPVKDDARHLRHLLADLAAQTHPPAEVIVVDNGSRDDSAEVARRAGCRLVVEPAPGIPAAPVAMPCSPCHVIVSPVGTVTPAASSSVLLANTM